MISTSTSIPDLEFVKKIQPKLSEFRRAYSSPDFSKKVLEKWTPRARIKIDLSAIKNALVSVGEVEGEILDLDRKRFLRKARDERWKVERDEEGKDWEPIRILKTGFRELELKNPSSEVFGTFKGADFMEKVKLSLKSISWDSQESKVNICDRFVHSLCSKRREHSVSQSVSGEDGSILDHEKNDDLDLRISSVLQSTGHNYDGGLWPDSTKNHSGDGKRHVAIVTTASLPWMTGTAVNPLFRAAFMARSEKQNVTLLVPWLCKSDQELVYPNSMTFDSPKSRKLTSGAAGGAGGLQVQFQKERRSILPAGDTSQFISSKEADIAILEEPEHLNWYHHGKRWTDKFNYVVGVVHTNYLEYIKREKNGALQAFFVKHINNWVTQVYCHKVLRLSAATQDLPKSVVCNVHGVNPKFLKVGEKVAAERELGSRPSPRGVLSGEDGLGEGDSHEVQSAARKLELNINFLKGRDHADDSLHGYKVFINPSVSDVLCTATAEALAMGKFVICADHPSNNFFKGFPNCLTYRTSEDFRARPLTAEQRYNLSWDAATQRFMEFSELDGVLSGAGERSLGAAMKKSISLPNLTEVTTASSTATTSILPPNVQNPVYGW
ncbi:unnamed protein product [Spirodela intermedia]|uniref:Uncharacterized protein n=1 Tax=Spirodela intermedia TaxID=51605 RepID=A0A7I8IRL3_SPIIN|nr:unnamed protein product [Spirodela intermedia]CAA6660504.1 unnamed protein product [Spirodela intermedia]